MNTSKLAVAGYPFGIHDVGDVEVGEVALRLGATGYNQNPH